MASASRARPNHSAANTTTSSLGLVEYLDSLPAPALILKSNDNTSHETILHVNPSLYSITRSTLDSKTLDVEGAPLADLLRVDNPNNMEDWLRHAMHVGSSITPFRTGLVFSSNLENGNAQSPRERLEVDWTAVVMQSTFVVLTGQVVGQNTNSHRELLIPPVQQQRKELLDRNSHTLAGPSDLHNGRWTEIDRLVGLLTGGGIMGDILRNFDWASSPLGPITTWPQSLLTALSLMLGSPSPMSIWWGPQFVLFYNDAYIPVTFGKHPWIYGKPGSEGWSEIWEELLPAALTTVEGKGSFNPEDLLFMTRRGFTEETYHTWSYVPIRQEDGTVGGLLNPTTECTGQVLLARRMKTLRDYSVLAGQTKTATEFLAIAADMLTASKKDISFALIYTGAVDHSDSASLHSAASVSSQGNMGEGTQSYVLTLCEAVGIPRGHEAAPETVSVDLSSKLKDSHIWPFQEVCRQRIAIETANAGFVEGIPGRGWDDPSRTVVTCPIIASDADEMRGILVFGTSGRLAYDDNFKSFVELFTRQTAASISAAVAYEDEVKRAQALAAIDRTKTAFFSSVSHELRTPLTLILGPLEEMISDRVNAATPLQLQRLSLISRNAKRLLKLVNSLLDFSRLEAGRMQASFKETNVAAFTRDLASVFRSAVEKGGVEYLVECDEDRKAYVDRDMWEKIVFNLIGNAFKFTLRGRIKVSVRHSGDKAGLVFAVEDTGTGIPSSEVNRVFERFHRVEGQTGRSYEGSGIGLALTDELVKLHGGTVKVTSELGKGSVFSVTIPYGTAHLPPDMVSSDDGGTGIDVEVTPPRSYGAAVVEEARYWLSTSSEDDSTDNGSIAESSDSSLTPGRSMPMTTRGCRVLLADDNADMRKYVKMFLSTWWNVVEAKDGQHALNMILTNPPDIVVSDVMMPILDGFGLLKALRSNPATKSLPFILLSARAGEEARVDGLRMGADDYLVKPFSAKELVARVHSHLEMSRLRVELEQRVKERTQELAESEWRYKAMATMSPVGIYKTNRVGHLTFANDKWWEISMHNRLSDPIGARYIESVHPDDRERVQDGWAMALRTSSWSCEFRWQSQKTGVIHHALSETITELDEAGNIVGLIGTLTDLTERKRLEKEKMDALEIAEKYQRRRAEEAESVRRQQELFIDMTCHELRNPLNGIYHNADLIHESLEKVQSEVNVIKKAVSFCNRTSDDAESARIGKSLTRINSDILQSIEAVETINQCAQHQKNIADDVLQVSKISMNLLRLSRVDYQPRQEIQSVVRMFETEANAKQINLELTVQPGFEMMGVDWVRGDPKRLAQIMINLLSNAIRFTERMESRNVTVTLDATATPPTMPAQAYADTSSSRSGSVHGSEDGDTERRIDGLWGRTSPSISSSNSDGHLQALQRAESTSGGTHETQKASPGTSAYICISISDSGVGMTLEEQALIFRRFSTSPKTYGEFGGSGLGLFISKRLVELQGGQIGVESTSGVGTTFKFYVRTEMRDSPPPGSVTGGKSPAPSRSDPIGYNGGTRASMSMLSRRRSSHADGPVPSLALPHSVSQEPATSHEEPQPQTPPPPPPPSEDKIMVLIVEDNVVNQKVLKRQLETAGYNTRIANHGGEALALLQRQSTDAPETPVFFDVILMDIEMPVMDGLQCATRIRATEKELTAIDTTSYAPSARVPIIAVTGNARKEYLHKAMEVGMDDFMVKPYIKKELVNKIEQLVSARRSVRVTG
ncbi:hypothetical protein PhCBS80983_g05265 [Powellomyces hirtus]|uniref:histidine kinase n=1 Tax=Powellomyces hirtus TaxID=109895 RepID=A0A507DUV6_9FUNG|nr:hypothetical protein PhCBS80983_g05265 [Powellomyces hirtus]